MSVVTHEVSVRELRNHTADVVAAVRGGESIRLTVNRVPVAEIVPSSADRSPWVSAATLRRVVSDAAADRGLLDDLADVRNQTVD